MGLRFRVVSILRRSIDRLAAVAKVANERGHGDRPRGVASQHGRSGCKSAPKVGSDSHSMKFGGEFALFPLENQRHATQFWKSLFRPERACCGERFLRRRNDGCDGQGRSRRGVLSRLRGGVAPGPQPLRASRTRLALFGTRRSPPLGDTAVFLRATRLPEADICRAFRGNRASSAGASNVAAGTYRPPFRLGAWRSTGGQLR